MPKSTTNLDATERAWAKYRFDVGGMRRWHSLVAHGIDVAAVLEALCEAPIVSARLARAAGRPLTQIDVARLGVFACLHDCGKANRGFWARQFPLDDPRREHAAGHIEETGTIFYGRVGEAAWEPLGLGRLAEWGAAAEAYLIATLSHHGSPTGERLRKANGDEFWKADNRYDPFVELARLRDAAFTMFPKAGLSGPDLPDAPRFIHLYAGLLTLADWIGSDEQHFPLTSGDDASRVGFARAQARELLTAFGLVGLRERRRPEVTRFDDLFGFPTRPLQQALDTIDAESLVILEGETGSGKTEAALWHFARLLEEGCVDSLYFALPTRVAATEIHGRITRAADTLFGQGAIKPVLAVPGYVRAGSVDGQRLPGFKVLWPDATDRRFSDGRWAAESPKRFLGAPVAVGTIDQALMAGLQLGHAHLRAAALSRSLLVVDEVHASDTYMTALLKQVLDNHLSVGGRALLMSATLGADARAYLTGRPTPCLSAAREIAYPAVTRGGATARTDGGPIVKSVRVDRQPLIADPSAVAALAAAAARDGATVVVVRNTVQDALTTQEALETAAESAHLFRVAGLVTLHHGRFAAEDRRLLDAQVTARFGKHRKSRGQVVIGTQTLEQSLDIDADLLITDLCPMDVLLQRIGRLHRHARSDRPPGYEAARVVVLTPPERSLAPFLFGPRHGLGHNREGAGVYGDVRVIEATWRLLERETQLVIPGMNRVLVEEATHPEALETIVAELGWEKEASLREGLAFAHRHIAARDGLSLAKPIEALTFPGVDDRVRTRLGLDDLNFLLATPARTPFGQMIRSLRVPQAIARRAKLLDRALPEQIAVEYATEGLVFPELGLRYTRIGLTAAL
ncbi:CRISPR-associated endonuclease/helicase Cas3 [Methylobacterium sp. 174MFSha1.1]|uniref:CRISPR-associated helicase Cas3' n=1 Tax=Methylobacterium sp. 174MFSha1.1 TaxID=1502749 RepID=UPI0008E1F1C5|nr:CRISPR-associated helicase Cas3' [Methylobacterium sp. 174MFSha1.1]SFU70624.1 CRISPR-associated endonuclease/helicase Cas3 [Methylobacterium sp. 174MFSha1.1]